MSTQIHASSIIPGVPGTVRWPACLAGAACLFALLATFRHAGQCAVMRWDTDPASSHGWLVPLAVIWLVWRRWQVSRDAIPDRVPARTVVTGCCSLLAGTLLYLYLLPALSPASTLFPAGLGFVVAVLGLLLVVAGPDVGRVYLPPCLLLFFMVPLPFAAQQPVAESLQQTVAWTSETAIWLLGHPVYREGYILHLADTVLEVAAGCSGLGQFMVFVAIGAFCGVYSGNTRQGVILVALALPVSVLANTMRITMTALIHIYLGAAWAEGVLHEAEGLVTALIGAGLLFGAAGMLNRWTGGSSDAVDADDEPGTTDAAARLSEPVAARNSGLGIPQRAGLVISLLLPSLMLSQTIQLAAAGYRRPPVALSMPLGEFPTQLGSWTGRDVAVNREYFLYGDAHLNRVYINAETGQSVTLWMVYTTDGRDRGHHPQACMRAIGCQEVPERNATVALPGDGAAAKRFYFQDPADGSGRWVSYWYHVFDTGERQQRTDLLKHLAPPPSRRSGLTAQIFATELTPADAIAADEFATLVEQALQASTLPENTRRDHRRGSYLMTADLTTR